MHQLTIVGVGPGNKQYLTAEAQSAITNADVLFASKRFKTLADEKMIYSLEPLGEALQNIEEKLNDSDVLVIVSGDPTCFSLANVIKQRVQSPVRYIAGISSIQTLFCKLAESTSSVVVESIHGRNVQKQRIITTIERNPITAFLTDAAFGPDMICQLLVEAGMNHVHIAIGENLTYEHERILMGSPSDFVSESFDQNCVTRIINEHIKEQVVVPTFRDQDFIRGDVPMTKEEIRMLSVCKLGIHANALVWDAGAGTGSIAMQCAALAVQGHVYAIERDEKATELLQQNKEKFKLMNVTVVPEVMPQGLRSLPDPTHVFIGGSGGHLAEIMEEICSRGFGIHVVINVISLKTLSEVRTILKQLPFIDIRIVQVQVNSLSERAEMLIAQNPIFIIQATTGEERV